MRSLLFFLILELTGFTDILIILSAVDSFKAHHIFEGLSKCLLSAGLIVFMVFFIIDEFDIMKKAKTKS